MKGEEFQVLTPPVMPLLVSRPPVGSLAFPFLMVVLFCCLFEMHVPLKLFT